MAEHFDAIVVGAGPAGNAAAYTMAKAGLSVLQLERGEYPGAKNVQGAILYADAVAELFPDFRDEAPLERHMSPAISAPRTSTKRSRTATPSSARSSTNGCRARYGKRARC